MGKARKARAANATAYENPLGDAFEDEGGSPPAGAAAFDNEAFEDEASPRGGTISPRGGRISPAAGAAAFDNEGGSPAGAGAFDSDVAPADAAAFDNDFVLDPTADVGGLEDMAAAKGAGKAAKAAAKAQKKEQAAADKARKAEEKAAKAGAAAFDNEVETDEGKRAADLSAEKTKKKSNNFDSKVKKLDKKKLVEEEFDEYEDPVALEPQPNSVGSSPGGSPRDGKADASFEIAADESSSAVLALDGTGPPDNSAGLAEAPPRLTKAGQRDRLDATMTALHPPT